MNHPLSIALITFINERPVGDFWRGVAEQQLIKFQAQAQWMEPYVIQEMPRWKPRRRQRGFVNKQTGEVYRTITQAAKALGVNRGTLSSQLRRRISYCPIRKITKLQTL